MFFNKILVICLLVIKQIYSQAENCLYTNPHETNFSSCLECEQGYTYNSDNNLCVKSKCQNFQYFDVDRLTCKSTCSNNQVMYQYSHLCQQQYLCPNLIEVGKSFNSGIVNQFFLNNYHDGKSQLQSDIITISQQDKNIIIWDANTGNMKTYFIGHSQPVIISSFDNYQQLLVTSTQQGEIIIWDYIQGRILNQVQWINSMGEQITSQSVIDVENSKITMFGFQGEFYLVNYKTLEINLFIAHTNIVQKVILINQLNAISYGDDGLILLWNTSSEKGYATLKSNNSICPFKLDYIIKSNQSDNTSILEIVFFGNIKEVEQTSTYIEIIQIEQQFPIKNCSNINNILTYKIDFLFSIKNFLIDDFSQNIIVYSQVNIDGLSFNKDKLKWESIFSYKVNNLNINNFLINQLYISQKNLFLLDQDGRLIILDYAQENNNYTIQPFNNNVNLQFKLKRGGVNGMILSQKNQALYIYGQQVVCLDLNQNKVQFIITNFLPSQLKQRQQINQVKFSIKFQIIITTANNGLLFMYNYLDGRLLGYLIHPQYTLQQVKQTQLYSIHLKIVQETTICASYSDQTVVCYNLSQSNKFQIFQLDSKIFDLLADNTLNNIVVLTLSKAIIYNLTSGNSISSVSCDQCFYQNRFLPSKSWLSTYNSIGSTYVWSYPSLSLQFFADNSEQNPTGSLISKQNDISDININLTYHQNGLLIIRYYNLTFYKSVQYRAQLNICGISYPIQIWCTTQIGTIAVFGIFTNYAGEKNLYPFPILYGKFTSQGDLAFVLMDYGSYGTSLQVANMRALTTDQAFNTPNQIISFYIDENLQRVLVGEDTGNLQAFSYNKKTNQIYLNFGNYTITKLIPIESKYKLVVLCNSIIIKNYFTMDTFRENKDHIAQVQDAIIDDDLNLIISFSQDPIKNVHYWFYIDNKSGFLLGHTSPVTNIIQDKYSNSIISSDSQGILIIWSLQTFQKVSKVDTLYDSTKIRQLILIPNLINQIIILGGNQTIIFNFNTKKIISKIQVSETSKMIIDIDYNNLLIYDLNIKVYNYQLGTKISELSGFDGIVKEVLIFNNYIVAYANLNILSFDRVNFYNMQAGKSTIEIYKALIIQNLFIFISNSQSSNIKLWDYTTGTMLADMENTYYPQKIKQIYQDSSAKLLIAINVENQIFMYNPFTSAISKITQFLLVGTPPKSNLNNLIIDQQNNLMFIYSTQDVEIWNYYVYLGSQGQRMTIPNDNQIIYIYNQVKDQILFFDKEQNVWNFQDNQLQYLVYLEEQVRFAILKNEAIIVGLDDRLVIYDQNFDQKYQFNVTVIQYFNENKINDIFFLDDSFNLYQMQIQSDFTMKTISKYVIQNSMRVLEIKSNVDFNHLILTDINGQLTIVDYQKNQILQQISNHSGPIRQVQFNSNTNMLITCSDDSTILIYQYMKEKITFSQNITQSGQILKMVLDTKQSRLLYWINLNQYVNILDVSNNFVKFNSILAPGNTCVNIKINYKYNFLIIYNLFQINIHQNDNLKLLWFIRHPQEINDIINILILNEQLFLIVTKNCLQLALLYQRSIQLIKKYTMSDSQLISASITNNFINLKGINQENIYNYTMVQDQSSFPSCIQQINNPKSQFSLQRSYFLLQNSLQNSQLKMNTIQIVIMIEDDPSFYLQRQDSIIKNGLEKIVLKYYCLDKLESKKNTLQMFTQPGDYNLDSLTIQNCILNLNNNYLYVFDSNLRNFTFSQIYYHNNQFQNITLYFRDIDILIIDEMSLTSSSLLFSVQDKNQPNTFYAARNGQILYINQLEIINCTIQNTILFSIVGFSEVIIQNLFLKNLTIAGSSQYICLFELLNIKALSIKNIYIQDIKSNTPSTIFNIGGIYYNHIQNITFFNSENCSLFQYQKQFNVDTYFQTIKNDYLILQDVQISFIQTLIPLIKVESDYFQASNLVIFNITCIGCYGTVLNLQNSQSIIDSSILNNNIGFYGGSIYSINSQKQFLITNTSVSFNKAQSGGAIYLDQSDLIILDCNITHNSAYIGGGIRYLKIIPKAIQDLQQNSTNNNIIMLNTASIFGKNIASYPRDIAIMKTNQDDSFSIQRIGHQYIVTNFRSGDYLNLIVQFIDEEETILRIPKIRQKEISEELFSEISKFSLEFETNNQTQITGQSFINMEQYDIEQFGFKTDQTILLAEPDNEFTIVLQSDSIKTLNAQKDKFNSEQFRQTLRLQFRDCEIGEIYIPQNQVQNSYCKPCPNGQYSLKKSNKQSENMNCINCPSQEAVTCQGKEIKIRNGYWRKDNMTDNIVQCNENLKSCVAEDPENKFYCKRGYIGPLCEQCDSTGEVWNDIYVSLGQYQNCVLFSDINTYFIQLFFILFGVIFYIIYGIKKTIQNARKNLYCYYLRIMGIACFGQYEKGDRSNVYIKLIMHFYYISSLVQKHLKIELPFDFVSQAVSTPIQSFQLAKLTFTYFKKQNEEQDIFGYQIFLVTIPFYFTLISLIVLLAEAYFKQKQLNRGTLINSIVFIFIFFQPDILANVIQMIECRQIGDTQYLSLDLLQLCYNPKHLKYVFLFTVPMILLWSIIFPCTLLYQIRKYKKELYKCQPTIRYGFLYKEYRNSEYYWEFVKMSMRVIIIFLNTVLNEKYWVVCQLTILILVFYFALTINYNPYKSKINNKQDQIAHLVLIVVYILYSIYLYLNQTNQSYLLQFIISILNYAYLIFLFYSIITEKVSTFFHRQIMKSPKILSILLKYKCCQSFLQNPKYSQKTNQVTVFKRWKLLRQIILNKDKSITKYRDTIIQNSASQNQSQQIQSYNSLLHNSKFQNKIKKYQASLQNSFSAMKSEDSPWKQKTKSIDTTTYQPSTLKTQKLENSSHILGASQDIQNFEQSENVGQNFKRYTNDKFASKALFSQCLQQKSYS